MDWIESFVDPLIAKIISNAEILTCIHCVGLENVWTAQSCLGTADCLLIADDWDLEAGVTIEDDEEWFIEIFEGISYKLLFTPNSTCDKSISGSNWSLSVNCFGFII